MVFTTVVACPCRGGYLSKTPPHATRLWVCWTDGKVEKIFHHEKCVSREREESHGLITTLLIISFVPPMFWDMSAAQTAKRRRRQMRKDPRYKARKGAAEALYLLRTTKGKKK